MGSFRLLRSAKSAVIWPASLVLLSGSLAACGASSGSTNVNTGTGGTDSTSAMTVKFATASAPDSIGTEGANYFAAQVAKATNGKINVKVYPNSELGDTSTVNTAVANGSIQFTSDDVLDSYVPSIDVLNTPYLFPNTTVANKALNSDGMYKLIWNKLQQKGLRVLGVWPSGFSYLFSTQPVGTVGDLKGMKIRTFVPAIEQPEFSAVGADAVSVEYNQVFTSLSTNLVQAVTDPPNLVVPLKWQEPAHYVVELNLSYVTTPLLVSNKFWQSLGPDQQSQIQQAAKKALAYEEQREEYWNNKALSQLKADSKVSVTSPDLQPFETAFKAAYPKINAKFPGVLPKIQQIVAASK